LGVRAALADARDVVVAAEAGDVATARAALRAEGPDLVVTDLELPDGDALAVAAAAREIAPSARVLVLAATANEVSVRQASVAGVGGYILKSRAPREIVAAIRDAAAGRPIAAPAARPREGRESDEATAPRAARAAVLDRLSAREREIFNLIIWGQTNKQVAVKLGISVKTVETHRSHINGKLQVHSAAELVRLASLCGALASDGASAVDDAAISTARGSRERLPGKIAVERATLPRLVAKMG